MWATFLGVISTNEALPNKLVRVTRFDFELPPKKGEVEGEYSKASSYTAFKLHGPCRCTISNWVQNNLRYTKGNSSDMDAHM